MRRARRLGMLAARQLRHHGKGIDRALEGIPDDELEELVTLEAEASHAAVERARSEWPHLTSAAEALLTWAEDRRELPASDLLWYAPVPGVAEAAESEARAALTAPVPPLGVERHAHLLARGFARIVLRDATAKSPTPTHSGGANHAEPQP